MRLAVSVSLISPVYGIERNVGFCIFTSVVAYWRWRRLLEKWLVCRIANSKYCLALFEAFTESNTIAFTLDRSSIFTAQASVALHLWSRALFIETYDRPLATMLLCKSSSNNFSRMPDWLDVVCPSCSNMLTVSKIPETHLRGDENARAGDHRFECRTCPYQLVLNRRYYERKYMEKKAVEDILGGQESWKNVDKTEGEHSWDWRGMIANPWSEMCERAMW